MEIHPLLHSHMSFEICYAELCYTKMIAKTEEVLAKTFMHSLI